MKLSVNLILGLALLGCSQDYSDSTLVVTLDAYEETQVAAQWWNHNIGTSLSVERGTCHKEPCVVVMLGDCAETGPLPPQWSYKACVVWGDPHSIEIQPKMLDDRDNIDFAMLLAHEIGHVLGYDHTGPGNVMSENAHAMRWEVP